MIGISTLQSLDQYTFLPVSKFT